jgi:hypothetical protein
MKKISAMLTALIMVMAAFVPLGVAQTQEDVPTVATVGDNSDPAAGPTFVGAFVLNDDGDPLHNMPGTQIMPELGVGLDLVDKEFWKYVVVTTPFGADNIAAVYEKLLDVNRVAMTPEMTMTEMTDWVEVQQVLAEALNQNVITQAEYDNYHYILDPAKRQAKIFKVPNTLDNHDEPGTYTVWFKVVDKQSRLSILEHPIEYMTILGIELDFAAINYGNIIPGVEKVVSGNEVLSDGDGYPTIKNQGNVPIQVRVSSTDLTEPLYGQTISAVNLSVELLGTHVYDLSGNGQVVPGQAFLQPCTPTQIDFDIKAPVGTAQGIYSGTISIVVVS